MGDYMVYNNNSKNKNYSFIYEEYSNQKSFDLTGDNIKKILGQNTDAVFREISIGENKLLNLSLIFFDGLADKTKISEFILKPLTNEIRFKDAKNEKELLELIANGDIYYADQNKVDDINILIDGLLSGSTALVFNEEKIAVLFDTKGFEKRAISDPFSENVVKGSRDSFVETLRDNTALVRRKIKSPNLVFEETKVGRRTLTNVAIVYIKGLTNMKIVAEVKKRLYAIDTDNVLVTGIIEEYLSDDPNCTFPQIQGTERPDKFSADIVEGRVGIIIDGLPVAFLMPGIFIQFLQASEDYSKSHVIGSILRLMRFILAFLTLTLPGFYIALTTFHQEIIPTVLALSIAKSKTGVAFPSFIEILVMLIAFEILLEAGKRIPRNIGQAVTIVGALIVGQAAVDAKLVSPVIVVVIAATAIFSFVIPDQDFSNALRLWRFILALFSSIMGLYGLLIGLIMLIHLLSRLESFGVPYLAPFVGSADIKTMLKDTIFRYPIRSQIKRPDSLQTENQKRQG